MEGDQGALYQLEFPVKPLYCVPFKASRELLATLLERQRQGDAQAGSIRWGGSDGRASHVISAGDQEWKASSVPDACDILLVPNGFQQPGSCCAVGRAQCKMQLEAKLTEDVSNKFKSRQHDAEKRAKERRAVRLGDGEAPRPGEVAVSKVRKVVRRATPPPSGMMIAAAGIKPGGTVPLRQAKPGGSGAPGGGPGARVGTAPQRPTAASRERTPPPASFSAGAKAGGPPPRGATPPPPGAAAAAARGKTPPPPSAAAAWGKAPRPGPPGGAAAAAAAARGKTPPPGGTSGGATAAGSGKERQPLQVTPRMAELARKSELTRLIVELLKNGRRLTKGGLSKELDAVASAAGVKAFEEAKVASARESVALFQSPGFYFIRPDVQRAVDREAAAAASAPPATAAAQALDPKAARPPVGGGGSSGTAEAKQRAQLNAAAEPRSRPATADAKQRGHAGGAAEPKARAGGSGAAAGDTKTRPASADIKQRQAAAADAKQRQQAAADAKQKRQAASADAKMRQAAADAKQQRQAAAADAKQRQAAAADGKQQRQAEAADHRQRPASAAEARQRAGGREDPLPPSAAGRPAAGAGAGSQQQHGTGSGARSNGTQAKRPRQLVMEPLDDEEDEEQDTAQPTAQRAAKLRKVSHGPPPPQPLLGREQADLGDTASRAQRPPQHHPAVAATMSGASDGQAAAGSPSKPQHAASGVSAAAANGRSGGGTVHPSWLVAASASRSPGASKGSSEQRGSGTTATAAAAGTGAPADPCSPPSTTDAGPPPHLAGEQQQQPAEPPPTDSDDEFGEWAGRPPAAVAEVCSPGQFLEYKKRYEAQYGGYVRLHDKIQKNRREFDALRAAAEGEPERRLQLQADAQRLWARRGARSQRWAAAFRTLHQELQATKAAMQAYVDGCRGARHSSSGGGGGGGSRGTPAGHSRDS